MGLDGKLQKNCGKLRDSVGILKEKKNSEPLGI
jgi:hypothetical protein